MERVFIWKMQLYVEYSTLNVINFENNVWGTEDPDWEKRFFTNNFTNFPKNWIKIVKDILNPSNNNTPHQEKRQIKQIILFLNH